MTDKNAFRNVVTKLIPHRESLAIQLFLVVFAFYLVISIVITSWQIGETYTRAQSDVSRELNILGRSVEGAMSAALWAYDDASMDSIILGMLEIPEILGVKVTDPKGESLLAAAGSIGDKGGVQINLSDERHIEKRFSYFTKLIREEFDVVHREDHKEEVIAHVAIYSNTGVVLDRIKFSVLVIVLSEIIEFAAMWFIFLWISSRMLGRPLAILTTATERLAQEDLKNFKVDIQSKHRNELKLLEEAFNSAGSKLHAAKDELENRMRLALSAGRIATWVWR